MNADQRRLNYLHRVLNEITKVCRSLYDGGAAELAQKYPQYAIINGPTTGTGRSGDLSVEVPNGGPNGTSWPIFFPKDWGKVNDAIREVNMAYNKIGWGHVLICERGKSTNTVLATFIRADVFWAQSVTTSLNELLHEALHDTNMGGPGHGHITGIVNTGDEVSDTIFDNLLRFLESAKVKNNKSLWQAILDEAGEPPQLPR